MAARCVECLGQHDGRGPAVLKEPTQDPDHFQCWSMDSAILALRWGITDLAFEIEFLDQCAVCSEPKPLVSFSHGDSSAMYDEILEEEVMRDFCRMRTRVERISPQNRCYCDGACW